MDKQRRIFSQLGLSLIVATVTAMTPSTIKMASVKVISKVLNIQSSRAEPPRVAFDEIFKTETLNEWNLLRSKSGAQNLNDQETDFVQSRSYEALRFQKVILHPMIFSKAEMKNPVEVVKEDRSWAAELPQSAQKRLAEAQERFGTLEDDWSAPTFQQIAEKKIQEIKQQEQPEVPKILVEAVLPDGTKANVQSIHNGGVQVKKEGDPNKEPSQYIVSGEIEYSGGGLPAGPRWQLRVAHYDDDIKKEEARVDQRNIYQIQVSKLSGSISAQLVDQQTGEVLGEGSYRLSAYSKDQIHGRAKIVIYKSNNQFAGSLVSYYRHPEELTGRNRAGTEKSIAARVLFASVDSEGKSDSDGTYRFDQVMKGSWGLLRSEAKDFYPAIYLVKSGEEKRLPLFPEKMIKAMKQIIADQALSSQVAETGSIVWGRVSQSGKPLAGAQVQVEFLEQFQPVYFNSLLIPEASLKATSENGFFAFVHVPAGMHSLVSSRGSAYLSHVNVVIDEDAVSIAEMESSLQTEKVDVKVFDAFSGSAQDADLEFQSLGEQIHTQGFAQLDLQPISRLSFLRVHPQKQEYLEALQVYDDSGEFIHVPLISKKWLEQLTDARRLNISPETGTIVGFTSSSDFQVYLSHEKKFPLENIIYFTAQGQISEFGVKGGGFIIQNVPPGVQSIVLADKNSSLLQTQVIPVDSSGLVVLKFR